jgi:Transposase zinc-binding domain
MRGALEVADVFRHHGAAYRQTHAGHLSLAQRRVIGAIEACRSATLGGHVEQCDGCGQIRINSHGSGSRREFCAMAASSTQQHDIGGERPGRRVGHWESGPHISRYARG